MPPMASAEAPAQVANCGHVNRTCRLDGGPGRSADRDASAAESSSHVSALAGGFRRLPARLGGDGGDRRDIPSAERLRDDRLARRADGGDLATLRKRCPRMCSTLSRSRRPSPCRARMLLRQRRSLTRHRRADAPAEETKPEARPDAPAGTVRTAAASTGRRGRRPIAATSTPIGTSSKGTTARRSGIAGEAPRVISDRAPARSDQTSVARASGGSALLPRLTSG